MKKPLIGIVGKPSKRSDVWHYFEIVDEFRFVLIKNNALPIGLLPTDRKIEFKLNEEVDMYKLSNEEREDLRSIILKLDGVILQGGFVSNEYEECVAKICIDENIPLLCICSGFNNLIRAGGGKVYHDNSLFHNQYGNNNAHEVKILKDSKLYNILKANSIKVNSIHTYITDKEDIKGFKVVAICQFDNTVEAVELDNKRFIMGIKWHPELIDSQVQIFEEFVKECRKEIY